MCLSLIALKAHPHYPLIIAHNRDEFLSRRSEGAQFWKENPELLAGKDVEQGGTWLGITRTGKIALVTNIRKGKRTPPKRCSRGHLVRDYLVNSLSVDDYLHHIAAQISDFGDFNLVLGTTDQVDYYSSLGTRFRLTHGIYGLSNHTLDSQWPKVVRGKKLFQEIIEQRKIEVEALFSVMKDTQVAPDKNLPDTGIDIETERALSPIFIQTRDYGTRSTTVILLSFKGNILFAERTYDGKLEEPTEKRWELKSMLKSA